MASLQAQWHSGGNAQSAIGFTGLPKSQWGKWEHKWRTSDGNEQIAARNGPSTLIKLKRRKLSCFQDGRPVMNSYERQQPDMQDSSAAQQLYSDSATLLGHSGGAALSLSNTNIYGGVNGHLMQHQQHSHGVDRLSGSHFNVVIAPIPLAEFATHIDRQKLNNNQGFVQVENTS